MVPESWSHLETKEPRFVSQCQGSLGHPQTGPGPPKLPGVSRYGCFHCGANIPKTATTLCVGSNTFNSWEMGAPAGPGDLGVAPIAPTMLFLVLYCLFSV